MEKGWPLLAYLPLHVHECLSILSDGTLIVSIAWLLVWAYKLPTEHQFNCHQQSCAVHAVTVINWLQKACGIPAIFSHVKCDWFSYPCLTEFLKKPDSFGTVPKTFRRLPDITEDVPMIFEGHCLQRLEASNLGGHLAEITYILKPRGGIVRR